QILHVLCNDLNARGVGLLAIVSAGRRRAGAAHILVPWVVRIGRGGYHGSRVRDKAKAGSRCQTVPHALMPCWTLGTQGSKLGTSGGRTAEVWTMPDPQLLEILVLALIAGVILFRLYTVLGRRTGHEAPPPDPRVPVNAPRE